MENNTGASIAEKSVGIEPALTDIQRNIKALAGQDVLPPTPTVQDVEDLAIHIKMTIPSSWRKSEYIYAYKRARGATDLVSTGGIWAVVTRSNHANIPDVAFDLATGAILYGDAMLCFTWSDYRMLNQKRVKRVFAEALTASENDKKYYEHGREVGVMYRNEKSGGYGGDKSRPPILAEKPEYDSIGDN